MKNKRLYKFVLSAMFIALGLTLPLLTGQIQQIGSMLLPMHIPVILCGLICGWKHGMGVGFAVPLLRSAVFSMPVLYPNAVAMSFELAAYGFLVGFLFEKAKWQCLKSLYRCLIISMIGGRFVWGIVMAVLMGANGGAFTFTAFLAGAFLNAIPGIVLQLVVIPAIMLALKRTHLVHFRGKKNEQKV